MELFKTFFEETEIESLEALIANPDPGRVKMYGGTGYVDMLKKKLERAKKAKAIQTHLKQSPLGRGLEDNEEAVKISKMFDEYMRKGEPQKAKQIMFSMYDHDPEGYKKLYNIFRSQYPEDAEDAVNDQLYDQYTQEGYKIGLEKFKSPRKAEMYAVKYAKEKMEQPGPHG